jgi:bacterioferritin (cytochrome b1)
MAAVHRCTLRGPGVPASSFTADITAIRERLRRKMKGGLVTGSHGQDWPGGGDQATRRLIEGILADEEEHARDLASLLGA